MRSAQVCRPSWYRVALRWGWCLSHACPWAGVSARSAPTATTAPQPGCSRADGGRQGTQRRRLAGASRSGTQCVPLHDRTRTEVGRRRPRAPGTWRRKPDLHVRRRRQLQAAPRSDAGPTAGSPAATTRVRPAAAPAGRIAGAATRPSPAAPVAGATPARPVRGAHRAGLRAAPRRREGRVSEAVYAGQRQAGQRKGDDDQPRDSSRPAAEHAAACAAVGLEGAEAHDDPARSAGHRSRRTQAVRRTTDRSRRAHRRSVVEAGPRSASAGPVRRLSRTHSPRPVPR
jgi:hypothetical protein